MTEWIVVSRTQHAHARYRPREGYRSAENLPVADVLLAELADLLPHYVLGFIQRNECYQPVAVLSLDGQANVYLAPNGKWLGRYVPASLRGYPFALANADEGSKVLCVHQAHLATDQGEPLFDDEGNLAVQVARTLNFLQQCDTNREATMAATRVLDNAGVIEPWPWQIAHGDPNQPVHVHGLYRINGEALSALDLDTYAGLRGNPMALAHAQLFSMRQVNQLTQRAQLLAQQKAAARPRESLDDVFGDNDGFVFDFE